MAIEDYEAELDQLDKEIADIDSALALLAAGDTEMVHQYGGFVFHVIDKCRIPPDVRILLVGAGSFRMEFEDGVGP